MDKIQKILDQLYPNPEIPLKHNSIYELLVAVILSAQCTDKKVNQITPLLPKIPQEMVLVDVLEDILKPLGLAKRKAKALREMSQQLLDKFKGDVPNNFEDLESLSGVGHKTASVIMLQGFGIPAFPVDTHIHRCAKRWGLSDGSSVEQTEKGLKKIFKKESRRSKMNLNLLKNYKYYLNFKNYQKQKKNSKRR